MWHYAYVFAVNAYMNCYITFECCAGSDLDCFTGNWAFCLWSDQREVGHMGYGSVAVMDCYLVTQ